MWQATISTSKLSENTRIFTFPILSKMLIVNISTHTNTHKRNALTHIHQHSCTRFSFARSLSRPLCIYQIVAFVFFYEFAISWWRLFFKTKLKRKDLFVNTTLHLCFALKCTNDCIVCINLGYVQHLHIFYIMVN